MEHKIEFIHALGDILRKYSQEAVDRFEYENKKGSEYVIIIYRNGYRKKVCITGDSCIAIMNDVYHAML